MDEDEIVRRLLDAMDQYDPYYDEVFWEVNARMRERGQAGKLDLAALTATTCHPRPPLPTRGLAGAQISDSIGQAGSYLTGGDALPSAASSSHDELR